MAKIGDVRRNAIRDLIHSPFLNKNRSYTLNDASLDVDLILSHVLKTTRSHLPTLLDTEISDEAKIEVEHLFKIRFDGLILAYIIEEKEFYGFSFYVNEDVLPPKADTEILVEKSLLAINEINHEKKSDELNILDVFTGSGCVAISIAASIPNLHNHYTLIDISEKALNIAKKNAKKLIGELDNFSFLLHDALLAFPVVNAKKYDLILANPPYIPHYEVLNLLIDGRGEPQIALDGGEDGLCFYHALGKHSFASLNEGGRLFSEIGDGQYEAVRNIFENEGFKSFQCYEDLSGEKRVIEARK